MQKKVRFSWVIPVLAAIGSMNTASGANAGACATCVNIDEAQSLHFISNVEVTNYPTNLSEDVTVFLIPFVTAPDGNMTQLPPIHVTGNGAYSSYPSGVLLTNPLFGTYHFGFIIHTNHAFGVDIGLKPGAVFSSRYGIRNTSHAPNLFSIPHGGEYNTETSTTFNYGPPTMYSGFAVPLPH